MSPSDWHAQSSVLIEIVCDIDMTKPRPHYFFSFTILVETLEAFGQRKTLLSGQRYSSRVVDSICIVSQPSSSSKWGHQPLSLVYLLLVA